MSKKLLALLPFALLSAGLAPGEDKPVGDFRLTDPRDGAVISLDGLKDKQAVVVVFVGTECPINNAYLPTLAALHQEYSSRGVQFLAVNSNLQDTPARVAEHARKGDIPFPVLKDPGSAVADLFGARRTPEVFLLDAKHIVRYRGRIDDQFGIGFRRPQPTRRDLAEALDEVLAGKPVTVPETRVAGCVIARPVKAGGEQVVSYTKDVAAILQKNCQECHRPGQIGPMALLTYGDAVAWSQTIGEVLQEGRMPPWLADPRFGRFDNDRRLSQKERDTLLAWVAQGCPKGDDRDLPAPREFTPGWSVGKPDVVFTMREAFEVPVAAGKGGVPYQYFEVPTGFTEDRWVVRAEAKAGDPSVVHHIIVFIVPPGETFHPRKPGNRVLCGVAPGDTALRLLPGVAKLVPARSTLVFQMHYTPNGKATADRSSVGLIFAKAPPERSALTLAVLNPTFHIPPGDPNYEVEATFRFKEDGHILGFMPHMHLRGKDFLYEAIQTDGKKEVLLSVPRYDFAWQGSYRLAKPYPMPKGSKLHCVAHFDNSAGNPNNPDPTKEVRWGDQTWEEMMIGWTEVIFDRKP